MNVVRGQVLPAWSSTRYTDGKPYAWLVHSGMITYPIARCAYLIRRDPKLRKQHSATADEYVAAVEETVHAFRHAWQKDSAKREGWYYDKGRNLPFNMQNAMGRTLVALWLATGKNRYREQAERLARYFKNRLRKKGTKFIWSYSPDNKKRPEDTSHAATNVDFAFTCFRAGIVFTREDIIQFVETFRGCVKGGKSFSGRVDGMGELKYLYGMGRWGHLGFVVDEVRDILFRYYQKKRKPSAFNAIAVSYLVETHNALEYDKVLRKNPVN